jgi:hypothetical protein
MKEDTTETNLPQKLSTNQQKRKKEGRMQDREKKRITAKTIFNHLAKTAPAIPRHEIHITSLYTHFEHRDKPAQSYTFWVMKHQKSTLASLFNSVTEKTWSDLFLTCTSSEFITQLETLNRDWEQLTLFSKQLSEQREGKEKC